MGRNTGEVGPQGSVILKAPRQDPTGNRRQRQGVLDLGIAGSP